MAQKSKRGGARQGAGHPCDGPEKRVTINMMVAPETARKIAEHAAARNISRGKMMDLLVETFGWTCLDQACPMRRPLGPTEDLPAPVAPVEDGDRSEKS